MENQSFPRSEDTNDSFSRKMQRVAPILPPTPAHADYFSDDKFTLIPNPVLNLVISGVLKDRDIVTYAFFLSRCGAMQALKGQNYAALSEGKIAAFLRCGTRTLRSSVSRLRKAGVIERLDTRGNTRTR